MAFRTALTVTLVTLLAERAHAFPGTLEDWQARYGAVSPSGDNAQCRLCHANANGGAPWNDYGWSLVLALGETGCDLDGDGTVSNPEAFFCVERADSDGDPGAASNIAEIVAGAQPGWTSGPTAPADIGLLDPLGTEPAPPPPPPPAPEETPGKLKLVQVVSPGESIQTAIDGAAEGGIVMVRPGVYRELADATNGLNISRGVTLVALPSPKERVVLQNAGNQRNGIVAVPADRTDCMSCHASMAPPFELKPGIPAPHGGLVMNPQIYGLTISGITISGFRNNGLFTENVDGFLIHDVRSVGNRNYGIFPTLSKNGAIVGSYAAGSDDSGIWVETSEDVLVSRNLVENNVNGLEISNSQRIEVANNVSRGNTVGLLAVYQPALFDDRPDFRAVDIHDNDLTDNNRASTARPDSILALVPRGIGMLLVGLDESTIGGNRVTGNNFVGVALADYCVLVSGSPFDCFADASIPPGFFLTQSAAANRIVNNLVTGNGTQPDPHPFSFVASDLALLTAGDHGNCYQGNSFSTAFSFLGVLPLCGP